jgi:hypothetical protein
MVRMLPIMSKRRIRHDICSRVQPLVGGHPAVESPDVARGIESRDRRLANRRNKVFPCVDAIKNLEQQNTEDDIVTAVARVVDDVVEQVLAYPIGRAVRIRKAMTRKYGVDR